MPSLALTSSLVAVIIGVASPPVRPAVRARPTAVATAPPVPVVQTIQLPSALPTVPHPSSAPAVVAERRAADLAAADRAAAKALSGTDLVSSPNVFRGLEKADSSLFEKPRPLGKEEELELVRRALFFIASTNAERALAAADGDAAAYGFNHAQIIAEMRREAEAKRVRRLEMAQIRIGAKANLATEMPVDVPDGMSDTEFRLSIALGRAAYNKLFHHHQKVVYYEVNKVWGGWQRATVMEKADFLQEGAQGLLRAIRLFDPNRGVRFTTYAAWHVRAFVLRALRDKSHIVRLPQGLQHDMSQIRKARYRHAVETHGHAASEADLAEMLQWPPSRVTAALKGLASASATSLDAEGGGYGGPNALHDNANAPMVARVASPKHGSVHAENAVYERQLKKTLHDVMAGRDPQRIQITRLKYGLEDGVEWTYPMLSARFNQTTNVLKGIVRTEVNFLRRSKKQVLQEFANHM